MKIAFFVVNAPALIAVVSLFANLAGATDDITDKPLSIEYYSKSNSGHCDEWLARSKMGHRLFMVAETKHAHIAAVMVHQPQHFWPERNRRDIRVTIPYKNVVIPYGRSDHHRKGLIARFYQYRGLIDTELRRQSGLLDGFLDNSFASVASNEWMPTFNIILAAQTP